MNTPFESGMFSHVVLLGGRAKGHCKVFQGLRGLELQRHEPIEKRHIFGRQARDFGGRLTWRVINYIYKIAISISVYP